METNLPTVEEYQRLKKQYEMLKQKVAETKGVVAAKKAELQKIFDKYGVSSVVELEERYQQDKQNAEKLYQQVIDYVKKTSSVLEDLEKRIAATESGESL